MSTLAYILEAPAVYTANSYLCICNLQYIKYIRCQQRSCIATYSIPSCRGCISCIGEGRVCCLWPVLDTTSLTKALTLFGLWPRAVHWSWYNRMLQITNIYQWLICLEQCLMWACSGARYFDKEEPQERNRCYLMTFVSKPNTFSWMPQSGKKNNMEAIHIAKWREEGPSSCFLLP